MRTRITAGTAFWIAAGLALAGCSAGADEHAPRVADGTRLSATDAWIWGERGDGPSPAFLTLRNSGSAPVRVLEVDARSGADVRIQDPGHPGALPVLDVPAHGSLQLDLGGPFLMLSGRSSELEAGTHEQLRLRLADGSVVLVDAEVRVPAISTHVGGPYGGPFCLPHGRNGDSEDCLPLHAEN